MDSFLSEARSAPLLATYGRSAVKRVARQEFLRDASPAGLHDRVGAELARRARPEIRRVVNATGVIIHTNLGRAPLSADAVRAVTAAASGYQTVELDLESGRRGSRGAGTAALVADLVGTEAAHLVNNNAAAVLLALASVAGGKTVLVSRGELPAIGGSFQIPEILEASGARLSEVGTTNKTRVGDYAKAFSKDVAAVLTVHPSNFEIRGFVERPAFEEIAAFCRKKRISWIHDLGSGNLTDLAPYGVAGEEKASDAIRAGAGIICFSGDKLFGGPQIGVIAGKKKLVEAGRKHPLARALRCDKLTLAAFFATLSAWIRGRPEELPIYAVARAPVEELRRRAERVASGLPSALDAKVMGTRSLFGGGTTPERTFPSVGLSIRRSDLPASDLVARLRSAEPPIIARVEEGRVILDFRTIFPDEDAPVAAALASL